jgi:hypothetical protein
MKFRRGLIAFCILVSPLLHCLQVAFFIKKTATGKIEIYEKGSVYSHVAMKVGDKWLNAHPWRGVELTNNLDGMGEIVEIMEDPSVDEPDQEFLDSVLGKKFFIFAAWDDSNIFYCSKVIGKYLNVNPLPIVVDEEIWQGRFQEYNGRPGLSPEGLHHELERRAYSHTYTESSCRLLLN